MSDIVERLRESAKLAWGYPGMLPWPEHGSPLPNEAAATIEALRAENARLREATLEEAAQEIERVGHNDYPNKLITDGYAFAVRSLKTRAARAARGETE